MYLRNFTFLFIAIAGISNLSIQNSFASEGWFSGSAFKRNVKKNEKLGNYPVSIACRNKPGTREFRPQVKISWKKGAKIWKSRLVSNTSAERRRINKQTMKYLGFRLKSRKTFTYGKSRQSWSCEIWYKK